jgi:hypothetical protein
MYSKVLFGYCYCRNKACHEGEWNRGQDTLKGEKPKKFQSSGFKPKGNFVKKGALLKQANPWGMLVGSPKEHAW